MRQKADNVGGVLKPGMELLAAEGLTQAFPFKLDWRSMLRVAGEAGLGDRTKQWVK